MLYNYGCLDCHDKLQKAKGGPLTSEEGQQVVFDVRHGMFPTKKELDVICCPRCKSKNVTKWLSGYDVVGYVSGNGFLDKAGCRREMAVHSLTRKDADTGESLDPYGYMRENGEAEDLAIRIKKSRQPKKQYFDTAPAEKPTTKKGRKKLS